MYNLLNANTEKKLYRACVELAFGLWLLYVSSLYRTPHGSQRLLLFMYPQNMVFMIFGVFQALNFWMLTQKVYKNEGSAIAIVSLVANSFVYMSFYSIVLFPISGIGIIEYFFVSVVIFSDFIGRLSSKKLPTIGQHPMTVLVFGALLFIIKAIVFYLFPDNIYGEYFYGNNTARYILAIVAGGGVIVLLSQLKTRFFPKMTKSKNFIDRIGQYITGIVKKGIALLSIPLILALILLCSVAALFMVKGILDDILGFIEPFLEKILSSGKNKIPVTEYYIVLQTLGFFSVLIYQAGSYMYLRRNLKTFVNKNLNDMKKKHPTVPSKAWSYMEKDGLTRPMLIAVDEDLYNFTFLEACEPQKFTAPTVSDKHHQLLTEAKGDVIEHSELKQENVSETSSKVEAKNESNVTNKVNKRKTKKSKNIDNSNENQEEH